MAEAKTLSKLLADLVAFKTVTGVESAANDCADYVDEYLSRLGMYVRRHIFQSFPALIATSQQTKQPKIMLQAHLDVVPAADELFVLQEKGGKLIGRGAFDMKFAGAVFLKLAEDLKDELQNYDFGIMFTFDEEVGGQDGVGKLLNSGYGAKVCVLPDAGDNWQLEVTQKGVWIARLTAKGKAVHGSRPWEGDNAIHRQLLALHEIRALFKDQGAESDTLSINKIHGGDAVNQVADWAEATLDIRFLSSDSYKNLSAKIESIATEHEINLETIACIHPVKTDLDHPLIVSFLDCAERVHGSPLTYINSLGNSDAHYFDERGIPTILLRPHGGDPHCDSEWVDKASLEKYYELIKLYVSRDAKIT